MLLAAGCGANRIFSRMPTQPARRARLASHGAGIIRFFGITWRGLPALGLDGWISPSLIPVKARFAHGRGTGALLHHRHGYSWTISGTKSASGSGSRRDGPNA